MHFNLKASVLAEAVIWASRGGVPRSACIATMGVVLGAPVIPVSAIP